MFGARKCRQSRHSLSRKCESSRGARELELLTFEPFHKDHGLAGPAEAGWACPKGPALEKHDIEDQKLRRSGKNGTRREREKEAKKEDDKPKKKLAPWQIANMRGKEPKKEEPKKCLFYQTDHH